MSKAKPTAGTWQWESGRLYGGDTVILSLNYDPDTGPTLEASEPDMDLIAAAPELLHAVERLMFAFDIGQKAGPNSAIAIGRNVLKKVKGQ